MSIAQRWAARNGKTTLEQTRGGKVLNELDLFGQNKFDNAKAAKIWNKASNKFSTAGKGVSTLLSRK